MAAARAGCAASATRKVVIWKRWRARPVARLTLDYSIKFYRQSKGIFKVNVAAADVRRIPIGGSRREDTMIAGLMSARPDVGAGLERCGLGAAQRMRSALEQRLKKLRRRARNPMSRRRLRYWALLIPSHANLSRPAPTKCEAVHICGSNHAGGS